MSSLSGTFVWYELLTTDPAAAADFYTSVVGWTDADAGMPDGEYRLFSVGSTRICGIDGHAAPCRRFRRSDRLARLHRCG
jgi:predicted enzyme related to lactoylglutathione lyase